MASDEFNNIAIYDIRNFNNMLHQLKTIENSTNNTMTANIF